MNNTTTQTTESNAPALDAALGICFYAENIGVTFKNANPISKNQALLDAVAKADSKYTVVDEVQTSFSIGTKEFGHLMHLVYCHVTEGKKLNVCFDGIFGFDAPDQHGIIQKFNAQLVTIGEIDEEDYTGEDRRQTMH